MNKMKEFLAKQKGKKTFKPTATPASILGGGTPAVASPNLPEEERQDPAAKGNDFSDWIDPAEEEFEAAATSTGGHLKLPTVAKAPSAHSTGDETKAWKVGSNASTPAGTLVAVSVVSESKETEATDAPEKTTSGPTEPEGKAATGDTPADKYVPRHKRTGGGGMASVPVAAAGKDINVGDAHQFPDLGDAFTKKPAAPTTVPTAAAAHAKKTTKKETKLKDTGHHVSKTEDSEKREYSEESEEVQFSESIDIVLASIRNLPPRKRVAPDLEASLMKFSGREKMQPREIPPSELEV